MALYNNKIKAIIFDNGGTLKFQPEHEDGGIKYIKMIMEIIPTDKSPEEFQKELAAGHKRYKAKALETWVEPSEEDLWTKFILPDFPDKDLLIKNAETLTSLLMNSQGNRYIDKNTPIVISELEKRGYILGLISNTMSKNLVPEEYEAAGIKDKFKTFILSAVTGIRKPDPRIFTIACEELGVKPEETVYIGDDPSRDVEGPRRKGMAEPIILKNKRTENIESLPEIQRPKYLIDSITELLDIFK